jgi:hypothetical protein
MPVLDARLYDMIAHSASHAVREAGQTLDHAKEMPG